MLNSLATDTAQRAIRPVLLFATMGVVALVVARQLLTLWENARLSAQQAEALKNLRRANARIEEQARQIAAHNAELENGIAHLKEVQAQLANGNLQARAHLTGGALLSLAGSLNIMAERLMRLGQTSMYAQRLIRALGELSVAFDRKAAGAPFIVPASCNDFMEINRLLLSMRLRGSAINRPPTNFPTTEPLRQNSVLQRSPTQPLTQHIPVPMHPLQRPQTPQAASPEQQNLPKTVLGVRPSPAARSLRTETYE
jgi:hypothetical protein